MKLKIHVTLFLLLVFLAGCGRPEAGTAQPSEPAPTEASVRPELDWRTAAWKFDTLSGATHDLYITEYITGLTYTAAYDNVSPVNFCCLEDRFYELDLWAQWTSGENKLTYYLSSYDNSSGEFQHQEINLPAPEQYGGDKAVAERLDVVSEDECVLFLVVSTGEEQETAAYLAVHMDMDGECLSVMDLYPAMQENGLEILPGYAYENAYADRQGYYYLLADYGLTGLDPGRIMVINAEGKMVDNIGSEEKDAVSVYAMKDPDGNSVFEIYTPGGTEIRLVGYGSAGEKQYAQVQLDPRTPKAMSGDGYLYYGTQDGMLYRWDLYSGSRELCMDYRGMGLNDRLHMTSGGDGEPLLLEDAGGDIRIYRLGTDPVGAAGTIRMISLVTDCQYVSRAAIEYTRNNPNNIIRVDKPDTTGMNYQEKAEAVESYRTRALAELAAGKGADIYYVPAEDMEMLYEKGVLADLSDVLPQECRDAVFPGALGCGVIDGKQIGLTPEAYVSLVMVDNTLWDRDHWTWDEAMTVKETVPEREHLLLRRYCFSFGGWGGGLITMEKLYFQYLSETPFLDLENRTCDFDSPRFIRLMEMMHYNAATPDGDEPIREQLGVAFVEQVHGFAEYAIMMGSYGGQYHLVGFPTDNSCGNYWNCDYYVVVNKDTAHWEAVKEYLVSLFALSNQEESWSPVRNDMIEEYIHPDYYNPSYDGLMWKTHPIPSKPDGSTWDQEYRELLETAVSYRESTSAIKRIIIEELSSYYSGDKDAQSVAALIQNRVQLYLDETG